MSLSPISSLVRHKLRWYSAPYLILTGVGLLSSLVQGLIVASSLATDLAIPPTLFTGFAAAVLITVALLTARRRFIWIMDDRAFKGIQFSSSSVHILRSIRFADVEEFSFLPDQQSSESVAGHRFYFCNKSGWSKDLSFQVKDGYEAATALEFFLLHIDRSAWEPELEDWVYGWLRAKGRHLPRTQ